MVINMMTLMTNPVPGTFTCLSMARQELIVVNIGLPYGISVIMTKTEMRQNKLTC